MKRHCLHFALVALLLAAGAARVLAAESGGASLRVVNWNVQTFFDAVADGTEYAEFKGAKSRWSAQKYGTRLERLATALRTMDADVVVLEELEKEAQLYDIYNQLAGTFRLSSLYAYGCFVADAGAAIGCGVLSRYPIDGVRVHSLDIGTESAPQPALRPLLELRVHKSGRMLALFVCHWKSKLGDGSERWRRHQERQLADCMARVVTAGGAALACGDFNMDVLEFASITDLRSVIDVPITGAIGGIEAQRVAAQQAVAEEADAGGVGALSAAAGAGVSQSVRYAGIARTATQRAVAAGTDESGMGALSVASSPAAANVVLRGALPLYVHAPWLAGGDVYADGSYWYKGAWERIDNFFGCGAAELRDFRVERSGDWADADGRPVRYDVWTGAGWSDHLPISCTVAF